MAEAKKRTTEADEDPEGFMGAGSVEESKAVAPPVAPPLPPRPAPRLPKAVAKPSVEAENEELRKKLAAAEARLAAKAHRKPGHTTYSSRGHHELDIERIEAADGQALHIGRKVLNEDNKRFMRGKSVTLAMQPPSAPPPGQEVRTPRRGQRIDRTEAI